MKNEKNGEQRGGFLSNAQASPNMSEIGSRLGGDGWQRGNQ